MQSKFARTFRLAVERRDEAGRLLDRIELGTDEFQGPAKARERLERLIAERPTLHGYSPVVDEIFSQPDFF